MPDDGRVAEAALGQLVADLVGQRSRPGDDADVALAEERGRDDPDVGLAGRQDAGAVGPDQAHAGIAAQLGDDPQLIVRGDALGDRRRSARCRRRPPRGSSRRRSAAGTKIIAALALRLHNRVLEGVEHRDALDVLAALAGGHPGDNLGPVVTVVDSVEAPFAAGDAGHAQPRVADRSGCSSRSPVLGVNAASSTTALRAPSSIVASTCTLGQLGLREQPASLLGRWCRRGARRTAPGARRGRTPRSDLWRPRRSG